MNLTYDERTVCARPDCGHPLSLHEADDRFTHEGGACGFMMNADHPDGDCDCMGFIVPGADDELPAILAAQDAA